MTQDNFQNFRTFQQSQVGNAVQALNGAVDSIEELSGIHLEAGKNLIKNAEQHTKDLLSVTDVAGALQVHSNFAQSMFSHGAALANRWMQFGNGLAKQADSHANATLEQIKLTAGYASSATASVPGAEHLQGAFKAGMSTLESALATGSDFVKKGAQAREQGIESVRKATDQVGDAIAGAAKSGQEAAASAVKAGKR